MASLTSSNISLVEYWLVTSVTRWDMVLEPKSNLRRQSLKLRKHNYDALLSGSKVQH